VSKGRREGRGVGCDRRLAGRRVYVDPGPGAARRAPEREPPEGEEKAPSGGFGVSNGFGRMRLF